MAITATYKDTDVTIKDAYVRVGRIWGSKNEGWNCWVEVFYKEGDDATAVPVFSVNTPYVDGENPFTALYKAIENSPHIITKEKLEAKPAEVLVQELTSDVAVEEPKKSRKKKSKE